MSTIDEVLAAAEVVDAVCVIDGETRIISVPAEYKELGVESDEKVTRVKFQCPKIVGDNIDLTEYNLYINYRNAGNKLNSYLVEDATVTGDIINFSWLLSRHVTESPGTISYIVCAKKSDDTGVINEWNTKVATGTVGIGLEATEEIEEQNIDAIEQILKCIVDLENKVDSGGIGGSNIAIDDTLTQRGKAADAKATGDAINLLSEEIGNAGKPTDDQIKTAVNAYLEENPVATSVTFPPIMQTAPLGQLFEAPMNYTAWCPGNLRYDNNLNKYVDLLYCNDVHVNPTQKGMFIVYIDPVTFQATVPVVSKYVDTDGITEIIPTGADGIGATNFNILNDGRYCIIKDNGDGKSMFRFISSDYGITWVKSEAVTGIPSTLYGCTVLSNGRWIGCDDTLNCYFYYSDDEGLTWTAVKPETGGYYYEGEACILELKENVLMAVGRMSMTGAGYYSSGDAEHALLSFSYTNGESWSKWVKSESIDNMNASSCTGFVHDGIVEIFAASRWHHRSANAVTDYTNTGKSGAITHYVATVENALNDKFTNRGIVVYANGMAGSDSDLPAQDFHAPCLATNGIGTDFLLVYFDRWVEPYTSESANHHFVYGSLYGFAPQEDADGRTGRTYSTKKIESLIAAAVKKLNIRIDEFIANGGKGETSDSFYVTDGLVYNIDAVSNDTISSKVLADKISGTECALTATTGYKVEFSKNGLIHASISTGAKGFLDNPQEFTIECCVYNRTEVSRYLGGIPYSTASAQVQFGRSGYNAYSYLNSSGEANTGNFTFVTFSAAPNRLQHLLFAYSADGIKGYLNGVFMGEIRTVDLDNFVSWNNYFSASNQRVITLSGSDTHYFRSFRVYGKALTAEEAQQNYNYEKYRLDA